MSKNPFSLLGGDLSDDEDAPKVVVPAKAAAPAPAKAAAGKKAEPAPKLAGNKAPKPVAPEAAAAAAAASKAAAKATTPKVGGSAAAKVQGKDKGATQRSQGERKSKTANGTPVAEASTDILAEQIKAAEDAAKAKDAEADAAATAEPAEPAAPVVEDKSISLAEFKLQQQEKKKALAALTAAKVERKAGEGATAADIKAGVKLESAGEVEGFFQGKATASAAAAGKPKADKAARKTVLEVDIKYKPLQTGDNERPERGERPERAERGERPERGSQSARGGRGGNSSGPRSPRKEGDAPAEAGATPSRGNNKSGARGARTPRPTPAATASGAAPAATAGAAFSLDADFPKL